MSTEKADVWVTGMERILDLPWVPMAFMATFFVGLGLGFGLRGGLNGAQRQSIYDNGVASGRREVAEQVQSSIPRCRDWGTVHSYRRTSEGWECRDCEWSTNRIANTGGER